MTSPTPLEAAAAAAYLLVLLPLVPFGLHRLRLAWLRLRPGGGTGADGPDPAGTGRAAAAGAAPGEAGPLPRVTVQLPLYNEAAVVGRLIDAACSLAYPRDRLEVQVLDDSTDETARIAAERVARWRSRGVDVRHLRRTRREGFKAGALAAGLEEANGDFLLLLDADFLPPSDLVQRLLPPFSDPRVGAVQAAWAHLNAEESWLTRGQALFLDAHFAVEHEARRRAGLFFNFNGSAGMWRRRCLEEAGGWQADTLTEDLDLSYRAQLAGWRLAYRDDVRVPAELPSDLPALEVQQTRWARGGIQTARKLLPRIWSAELPGGVKLEATAHLLGHAIHPLTVFLGVGLAALGWAGGAGTLLPGWVHAGAFGLATLPFLLFYGLAAGIRGYGGVEALRAIGSALLLGLALGVPLTAAVARALGRAGGRFERTPKRGGASPRYAALHRPWSTVARTVLAAALLLAAGRLAAAGALGALPFTGLFASGYGAATLELLRRPRCSEASRRRGPRAGPGRARGRRP